MNSMNSLDKALAQLDDEWTSERSTTHLHPNNFGPGIYEDVPFEQYQQIPALNKSSLTRLKRSPAHYKHSKSKQEDETPFLRLGSLVHYGQLEPQLLVRNYLVVPEEKFIEEVQRERADEIKAEIESKGKSKLKLYENVRATKAYKDRVRDYMEKHPNKERIPLSEFRRMGGILQSLNRDGNSQAAFAKGRPEVTVVWKHPKHGFLCKARIDWLSISMKCIVDLKTAWDALYFNVSKFDYHIQAATYLEGYELARKTLTAHQRRKWPRLKTSLTPPFQFVVLETDEPYSARCAPIDAKSLLYGKQEADYLYDLYAKCERENYWPGPPTPEAWTVSPHYEPMKFATATPKSEQPT